MTSKTPADVSEAIKKLSASDQVLIQTYIAKLKSTISDLQEQLNGEDGHYHGGERCTDNHDHGHDHHSQEEAAACCDHSHQHGHTHEHVDHSDDDEIPAWKKEAANADPTAPPFGGTWDAESSLDAADLPPMYSGDGSDDDFDKAARAKMEASDLKSEGRYEEALDKFNEAVLAAEPSALLLANRAHVLFQLTRFAAAIRDCDEALQKNPDSAKALRIRGECQFKRGSYHEALRDLSAAQTIDFDEEAAVMLKEATEKCREIDAVEVKKKVEEEEKLKKRAAEIKKAREDANREAEEEASRQRSAAGGAGGIPGMGGMPGMAGMQGMMAGLMSDPEIAEGMKNPKIQKAFTDLMSGPGGPMGLMSNPAKLQELMADPEVGPFLQKFMSKVMGGAGGGMGGMPGMGGVPGTGGAGGFGGGMADMDDDDLDEMPDLVD